MNKDYYFEIFSYVNGNSYSGWSYDDFRVISAESGQEAEQIAREITGKMSERSEIFKYEPRNLRTL
jgi:hypothetical protein